MWSGNSTVRNRQWCQQRYRESTQHGSGVISTNGQRLHVPTSSPVFPCRHHSHVLGAIPSRKTSGRYATAIVTTIANSIRSRPVRSIAALSRVSRTPESTFQCNVAPAPLAYFCPWYPICGGAVSIILIAKLVIVV